MASAGTLLSDLDSRSPVFNKDDDLVNKILADMNVPSASNPVMNQQPMQPPSGNGRMIQAPNPNTTYPTAIDPGTATAHMIGKEYPTAADFANLMHTSPMSHGGSQFASVPQYAAPPQPTLIDTTKGNLYSDIVTQVKQPLLVAIIIFLVSLPIINVLVGHYFPSLLRIGGDLTTAGMALKACIGGFLFWFIQKILVPLMVV
uniref:Uncharacterized protein n=1 Tax=viral metagenome TaxID=1070528 RepID=A0A6C0KN19_9ZZZZ